MNFIAFIWRSVYHQIAVLRSGIAFYVLPLKTLQGLLIEGHCKYLAKHGGVRPKKHDSFHCAITEQELAPFKDGWLAEFRDNRGLHVIDIGA